MSGHPLPAPQQVKRKGASGGGAAGGGGGPGASLRKKSGGGGRVQDYLHPVTDAQADLLAGTGNKDPLQDIRNKSGADVKLDPNTSPVQGMKTVIIRGLPPQIEAAVRLISQETGAQGTISEQVQTFWLHWVQDAFPDLDSRAYFLPSLYFNRVPLTRHLTAGKDVLVHRTAPGQAGQSNQPQTFPSTSAKTSSRQPLNVLDSDVRDDAAMQRVLLCLQKFSEQTGEVLFGMSQLQFGQYLGEPCYAAAAAQLPLPSSLKKLSKGDFDVLLIHRRYGFVVCEVKSVGSNFTQLNSSTDDLLNTIRNKLKNAVSQLDKAQKMLSHLASDVSSGLATTKTIAVPNLTASQVQQAISGDPQLTEDLRRCLGAANPADITGLCLCSDQLSDPKTPWEVSENVLRELGSWWQRRVAVSGPDAHMTCDVYKKLVARFCGPATTVTIQCTSPPRLCVKTLGHAVSHTGELYAVQITLFPEQVHLLSSAPPRVFITGPPGTGKTLMLLLMATEWLRREDVYIVSSGWWSLAACRMLHALLEETARSLRVAGASPGQPHLKQYDFTDEKQRDKAVNDLTLVPKLKGCTLHLIADEPGPGPETQPLLDKLLAAVPDLHFWMACCYHMHVPAGWQEERLTRPLRFPPAVLREVELGEEFTGEYPNVLAYSERGMPDHTYGPPVRRIYHQGPDHSERKIHDCETCGKEVAGFLHSLRTVSVNTSTSGSAPPLLQWKDVLVLSWRAVKRGMGVVKGLEENGVEVRMISNDDDIEDVATARSDAVWLVRGQQVRGLERKVVVCLEDVHDVRLLDMSRCTSQLVIVTAST